jgi:hypothetical protein
MAPEMLFAFGKYNSNVDVFSTGTMVYQAIYNTPIQTLMMMRKLGLFVLP